MIEIFPHFSVANFSNTYLVGNTETKEAILIDPGHFDLELLQLIEENDYSISGIFVTHSHASHCKGIRTIKKIYDARIFSGSDIVEEVSCERVFDNNVIEIAGFEVKSVAMAGHSRDSFVYFIDSFIFTGDSLEAGTIGKTSSEFLEAQLKDNITNKLFSLNRNYFIFPGHGPCTTLELEKMFNYSV
ncbi:MAG: MBL fold metallo-hydrolase [Spirochaetales bacterium]|nr:MBL fold metallo-hydrolase [Spirochaetales bacterium]